MTDATYVTVNGKVIPSAEAQISIASPAAKYGIGVFEGLRGYWNADDEQLYVFRLREHLAHLKQSMKLLRLDDEYTIEQLEACVLDMIRANDFKTTIQMRITALLDDSDSARTDNGPIGVYVEGGPCPPHPFMRSGLTAGTSSWARTADNALPVRIKCNANYVNARLAELEARAGGFDRAIFLNNRGKVSEGPGATLFLIRNGQPATPSPSNDLLESITRDTLMHLLRETQDMDTRERDVDRTEIYAADEAFLCGTLAEVTPIISLDGISVGDGTVGPITRALQKTYLDTVTGASADHADWRTPVYI
jgi:branched-chain amino acid aminotransferase